VRSRHEHVSIDAQSEAAEDDRSGDPRERLATRPPGEKIFERSHTLTRGPEDLIGLGIRREEPGLG
jgi:hypothetical protein